MMLGLFFWKYCSLDNFQSSFIGVDQKCLLSAAVQEYEPTFAKVSERVLTFALFRCHDVGGRDPDVQFPDSETCGQEEIPLWRPQQRPPGDKNEQKIDSPSLFLS